MLSVEIAIILVGIAIAVVGFYFLYILERRGTWDALLHGRGRKILILVSILSLSAGGFAGMMCIHGQCGFFLYLFAPASIFIGVYFLAVAVFYRTSGGERK